jgi:hypothetical protein
LGVARSVKHGFFSQPVTAMVRLPNPGEEPTSLATIDLIRAKVLAGEYEFAIPHFFEEMANDGLLLADIAMAIATGRVRRRFSRDPRGVRYEIVGTATDERKVAVICRLKETGKLLFITTYALE